MNNNTQHKIPELRFPEFEGEWVLLKLSDVAKITTGNTPPTSQKEYYNGEFLFVSPADLNKGRFVDSTKTTLTEKGINKGRKIKKGSSLFVSIGSTIGKVGQAGFDCITNQQINALDAKTNFSDDFIYTLLLKYGQKIKLLAGVQAVPQLNKSDFSKLKFRFPKFPEQSKVADFFLSIDKRINLLQKKKTEFEQYKKGVMQKIFSQEIRFKITNEVGELVEPPDWEEKKLGDLGYTFNGLTGKSKDDFGEGKPYIQYMQIFRDAKIDTSMFGLVKIENGENQNSAQYGDIFFTTSSETPNEIGAASVLTEHVEDVYLNSFCFGYRPNLLDELVPEFSQFFFRSNKVRKEIIKLAQGSTRFNMSKVELMKLKFDFPKKAEQQKIASFLSSIDKKIEKTEQQIEASQQWKKGLLQKMFV